MAEAGWREVIFLAGAADRRALELALRELAGRLGQRLEAGGLAYREIELEMETEAGNGSAGRRFPRPQGASSLERHLVALLLRLHPAAPVERLAAWLGGLAPAPVEQLTLFGSEPAGGERRRSRWPAETDFGPSRPVIRASLLEEDRREKMLAFYDPFRQRRMGSRGPAA